VHDLLFAGDRVVDLTRLLTGAGQRAAGAAGVVERPAVVVPHLDQDEVARSACGQDALPAALRTEGPAAAAADSRALDLGASGVEPGRDGVAPALLPSRPVLDRRVADDEQGGAGRRQVPLPDGGEALVPSRPP